MTTPSAGDSLYRQICDGLSRPLNTALFERIAVDLLRPIYPGLVLIGGSGDGAISEPDGGPPILVCTTSPEVGRNLGKSLQSYGGGSRKVVFVTSQPLTPRKRRNLREKARELDFELRNIHDQKDLAGRLYDDPARRRELLGLTGELPALSLYPLSHTGGDPRMLGRYHAPRRHRPLRHDAPFEEGRLLGREEDLAWLRAQTTDFLLAGQPGVGKRSLLQVLASEGRGLFVVSDDMHRVADNYRAEKPEFLFVDDAHLRGDLLERILWVREELGAPFKVAATAWLGKDFELGETKKVRPVSVAVAAEIVRSVDNRWSEEFVDEIVSQSRRRPGLAVSLAEHFATRGDAVDSGSEFNRPAESTAAHAHLNVRDLVNEQLLLRQIEQIARLDRRQLHMLAHFALGGTRGATLAKVARAMDLAEIDVCEVLRKTAVTGVIEQRDISGTLSAVTVVGQALRSALLGRAFFGDQLNLSVDRALDATVDSSSTTDALVWAMARKQAVPHELVRQRLPGNLNDTTSAELWQQYARTGRAAVQWILSEHPCKIPWVADSALEFAPEQSLSLLIKSAMQNDVLRDWSGDMSLSAIEKWIREAGSASLERRTRLLDAVMTALDDGPCSIALVLFRHVFSLRFQSPVSAERSYESPAWDDFGIGWDETPAGSITHFSFSVGTLSAECVEGLYTLWKDRALSFFREAGQDGIKAAQNVATSWANAPKRLRSILSAECAVVVRNSAVAMVSDVAALADHRDGVVLWARALLNRCDLPVVDLPPIAPELDALFSLEFDADEPRGRKAATRTIAEELSAKVPEAGVEKLFDWREEAQLTGYQSSSRAVVAVARRIAETTPNPEEWLAVLATRQAPVDWVAPFFDAILASDQDFAKAWQVLGVGGQYDNLLVQAAIHHHGSISDEVVEWVTDALPKVGVPWEFVDWKNISDEWQKRIFNCSDSQTATAAASAMFRHREERSLELSEMSPRLLAAWRKAILNSEDEYLLQRVFAADPEVAREWLLAAPCEPVLSGSTADLNVDDLVHYFSRGLEQPHVTQEVYQTAAKVLGEDDRRKLIRVMDPDTTAQAFLALVGTNLKLYEALLARPETQHVHLRPFRDDVLSVPLVRAATTWLAQVCKPADLPYWTQHSDRRVRRIVNVLVEMGQIPVPRHHGGTR